MSFTTQCNIYMFFKMINTYICHLIQIMNNASLDRSDQRDTTRGGKSLAPHAKSPMGGAGLRNTKAERCAQARHGALRRFLAVPAAHVGVQSRFNHFNGSMVFGLVQLPLQIPNGERCLNK